MKRVQLKLATDHASFAAMHAAFAACFAAMERGLSRRLADRVCEAFGLVGENAGEFGADLINSFVCIRCDMTASGTDHAAFRADPTDLFRELVFAVACELNLKRVDVHGWPILSLVPDNASMTEAGGVRNSTGGGQ